ncbi:tyrosine-type recombinase/integrase [Myxococcota bacterium]
MTSHSGDGLPSESIPVHLKRIAGSSITGRHLAWLLQTTRDSFLLSLRARRLSTAYLRHSKLIINECARFCESRERCEPWEVYGAFQPYWAQLRAKQPFTPSYLYTHKRELRHFLFWYQQQVALGRLVVGGLSATQLKAYWSAQPVALPYRHKILAGHLPSFLSFLKNRPEADLRGPLDLLLDEYLEERRLAMRGRGYGYLLTELAKIVTRRHLLWLAQQGYLPIDVATPDVDAPTPSEPKPLFEYFEAKLDPELPNDLRGPLVDYLGELCERELSKNRIATVLRTCSTLCRVLADTNQHSFSRLSIKQVDQVVSSLVCAPSDDLLRRRQQVQQHHGMLRGFLWFLQQRRLLDRDLASALISPPCYRASTPPTVLSEGQIFTLLGSVDRGDTRGRRCYAILLLITTYGLRPIDVARLELDDIHWRDERLGVVQSKTGAALALPLLPDVATALSDYLCQDRAFKLQHRHLFVSLNWPYHGLTRRTVSNTVERAFREAGMPWGRARHLRASVATHLLRQGEPLSIIQEVLGHRTVNTTQRYAVTDVEMLRQVLAESDR